jgi:phage terminase large subunit-like protein
VNPSKYAEIANGANEDGAAGDHHFHAGTVHLAKDAPWLDELIAELLGFPGVRHDDQVDSVSQALAFIDWLEANRSGWEELRI